MTTIALLVSIAGGAATAGEVSAAVGQSCQVSATLPTGVTIARFEILAYPPGFACPSGWTTEGDIFVYTGASPSSFTLDRWGKWRFGLRYSSLHHVTTCVDIESPQPLSLRDMANGEQDEFGGCLEDHQYNLRQLAAIIGSLTSSTVTSVTGTNLIEADPTTGDVVVGIDMTTASAGQVVMATGSPLAATWENLTSVADGVTHMMCEVAVFTEDINTASPGATFQGYSPVGVTRLFLLHQDTPQENGPWDWNGAAVQMTRPIDWTGTIDITHPHIFPCRRVMNNSQAENLLAAKEANVSLLNSVSFATIGTGSKTIGSSIVQFSAMSPTWPLFREWHPPVAAAARTNVDITNPGTDTFDGVTVSIRGTILLTAQTNGVERGPWQFVAADQPLIRPVDFPADLQIEPGIAHYWSVQAGDSAGDGEIWWCYGSGKVWESGTAFGFPTFDWRVVGGATVRSITEGTGIDVSDDGNGNVTISNSGVISVTGGDGCSNTGTASNPIITVNVDGATIDTASDAITLGTVPLDHIDATSADEGEFIGRAGGVTNWLKLASYAGGYVHERCLAVFFSNINVSSPGSSAYGVTFASNERYLMIGQSTASQNGIWLWNGSTVEMSRPSDWTGTINADISHAVPAQVSHITTDTYAGSDSWVMWLLNKSGTVTVGTTSVSFRCASPIHTLGTVRHTPARIAIGYNVNVSNPGGSSFEGVTLSSSDVVLLAGQSDATQKGLWRFNGPSSVMSRVAEFAAGTYLAPYLVHEFPISEGVRSAPGEVWQVYETTDQYVGSTSTWVWRRIGGSRIYNSYLDSSSYWQGHNVDESTWTVKKMWRLGPYGFYLYCCDNAASDSYYMRQYYEATGGRYFFSIGGATTTYSPSIRCFDNADSTYPNELHFYQTGMDLAWRFDADGNLVPGGGNTLGTAAVPATVIAERICIPIASTLEISAGGAVTVTGSNHLVDTYGGAASDDLDTINGGVDGQLLILHTVTSTRDVTLRHMIGNIYLSAGTAVTLGSSGQSIVLRYKASADTWYQTPILP